MIKLLNKKRDYFFAIASYLGGLLDVESPSVDSKT